MRNISVIFSLVFALSLETEQVIDSSQDTLSEGKGVIELTRKIRNAFHPPCYPCYWSYCMMCEVVTPYPDLSVNRDPNPTTEPSTTTTIPAILNETTVPFDETVKRYCPDGTKEHSGSCVEVVDCRPGYDLRNYTCMLTNVGCPLYYDMINGTCVQRRVCPNNYFLENGICVPAPPTCPDDLHWNGQKCVVVNIKCPSGATPSGRDCITVITECPLGYFKVRGRCERIRHPSCHDETQLDSSGFCTGKTQKCPAGTTQEWNGCIWRAYYCPSGWRRRGNECIKALPGPLIRTTTNNPGDCIDHTCHVCPTNLMFCNWQCVPPVACKSDCVQPGGCHSQPDININIYN